MVLYIPDLVQYIQDLEVRSYNLSCYRGRLWYPGIDRSLSPTVYSKPVMPVCCAVRGCDAECLYDDCWAALEPETRCLQLKKINCLAVVQVL